MDAECPTCHEVAKVHGGVAVAWLRCNPCQKWHLWQAADAPPDVAAAVRDNERVLRLWVGFAGKLKELLAESNRVSAVALQGAEASDVLVAVANTIDKLRERVHQVPTVRIPLLARRPTGSTAPVLEEPEVVDLVDFLSGNGASARRRYSPLTADDESEVRCPVCHAYVVPADIIEEAGWCVACADATG